MTDQEFIGGAPEEMPTDTGLQTADSTTITERARVGVLVVEVQSLIITYARTHIEIGRKLIEIRDRTQPGEWLRILADLGFQPRTAYDYMAVASKVEAMPRLKDLAAANFSKVLTLIQSTTDEDLAAIASGQGELKLDDIESMSVRKLKDALRKRTLEVDTIVAEETKTLRAEAEAAIRRAELAEAELNGDWQTAESLSRDIRGCANDLAQYTGSLSGILENLDGYAETRALHAMQAAISASVTLLQDLWTQLQERVHNDWVEE